MYGQIYISRKGDREDILKYIENFRKYDDAQLLKHSESVKKLGIVGSHQQGLHLIAFNVVMMERFNDSPVIIEDNCLIRVKPPDDIQNEKKEDDE